MGKSTQGAAAKACKRHGIDYAALPRGMVIGTVEITACRLDDGVAFDREAQAYALSAGKLPTPTDFAAQAAITTARFISSSDTRRRST